MGAATPSGHRWGAGWPQSRAGWNESEVKMGNYRFVSCACWERVSAGHGRRTGCVCRCNSRRTGENLTEGSASRPRAGETVRQRGVNNCGG